MKKCPNCGNSLSWEMTYLLGEPVVYWSCFQCGWSSTKQTADIKIEIQELKE